jgi:transcriptional regulator with XRE-family HTH domain
MTNERLRSVIAAAGYSYETVATDVGVDPKTVERWVTSGRTPHRTHRWRAARLLGHDEAYLWPAVLGDARTGAASEAELLRMYPTRGSVPMDLWMSQLREAGESLDLLAYAGLFLLDNNPDVADLIKTRAEMGTQVRILLGDPDSNIVRLRGQEEGIGDGLAERIRIALRYLTPAIGAPGVQIRQHSTTLYASIYRSDDSMLVNLHIFGSGAPANPVMHLRRVPGGRVFASYQRSFERVWHSATPLMPPAPPSMMSW